MPFFKKKVIVWLCIVVFVVKSGAESEENTLNKTCTISTEENLTLNCSRQGIDTVPTNWPDQLIKADKDLTILISFKNNSIANVTQLPSLPASKILVSFQNNRIVEIEDDAFRNMERLVYLDLSFNKITGQVLRSEIFQGPYNDGVYSSIALETLILGNNEIHSLDKDLFRYTPNITKLYLNNNPIEILDHVTLLALSSASRLEFLDLSSTQLDNIPMDAFRGLISLSQLDLSHNRFVAVPESLSVVGSTLQFLTFNDNHIVELNDDSFVGLTNLKELSVAENDYLEEVKRGTFTPLKSLRVLHLCHNQELRYISHNAFKGLKDKWTLAEIYLDENNLSELSTDLLPWNKLEVLGMTGNFWLCNCDLANIVIKQGAASKFPSTEKPVCASPQKYAGSYVTDVTPNYCPAFDKTFKMKESFSLSDVKPKHVIWSVVGVGAVVVIGMLLGIITNTVKTLYEKRISTQPIHYVNINADSSYA